MASKIFMGDMPELMENILNNLNNEFYSLYSCVLVNRYWCKMSIPILWQNPFSFDQNSLFISKYFSFLDENEKFVLKAYGINTKFPNTLFNYASFLKVLDLSCLEWKVKKWIDFQLADSKSYNMHSIYLIINLLFKLFIESGATLHRLVLYFFDNEINPEVFYSLGRNELFFSRLQDLSLGAIADFSSENATALLKILAKNATRISVLKLDEFYSDYEPQLFHALICIIKSQEQLKQFSLIGGEEFPTEFHGIVSALESQKKSLQEIIIESCTCSTEFNVLTNCKNLEILRIRFCDDMKMLEACLSTLEITGCLIDASNIVHILKKSGTLLQRLKLVSTDGPTREGSLLLETLKSSCPNIIYLNISDVGLSTQFLELISNLQKLQFLTLWPLHGINSIPEEELKIRIIQLSTILPSTLQYLDIRYSCLNSCIDILLNNCYAPLKTLLIHRLDNEKKAKALIEFCIRKRSLNYVGVISRYMNLDNNIKKEVEEYVTLVPYGRIVVNC
ncbi:hypothetical protein F8M41_001594 [Gigaspora margarita]|uniref:F-box domain-containing protein n=1 Tax=Gigaspora margarita TaxID=4874 RepID=A0A8H3XG48_GIGMA|nr:hypothetical protein F8M41_001594 [Gigaspora margarita]